MFYDPFRLVLRLTSTKQEYTENILRIPYHLVKISGDLSTIVHELATGGERINAIFEESFTTKEEPVENKEEYLANLLRTRR